MHIELMKALRNRIEAAKELHHEDSPEFQAVVDSVLKSCRDSIEGILDEAIAHRAALQAKLPG